MKTDQTEKSTETTGQVVRQSSERISHIQLVWYLSPEKKPDYRHLEEWMQDFASVTITAPHDAPPDLPVAGRWQKYDRKESKADVWNRMLDEAGQGWVLFLEDDESVSAKELPSADKLRTDTCIPALIQWSSSAALQQCYQVRLVSSEKKKIFQGVALPDCTDHIFRDRMKVADKPVFIRRNTSPWANLDPDAELSAERPSPQVFLLMGARFFEEKNFAYASSHYRRVLRDNMVLQHDRLAAMNGLASCMAEQYKWEQASGMALSSIDLQKKQYLPYLILFRIHQLAKRWREAHDVLKRYHGLINAYSRANFDKFLSERETLVQLADMAFRAGLRSEAFYYYKKIHAIKGEKDNMELLRRLLLFAIELNNKKEAIHYFRLAFTGRYPDKLDEKSEAEFFEYLNLFMEQGWYEFAAETCSMVAEAQPGNEAIKRRWLVALSRSKDMKKAHEVVQRIQRKKKTG